ncbi:MAG: hypothetical protein ACJZ1O_03170 [Candidatus Neomarinimicrobiota bacterium]
MQIKIWILLFLVIFGCARVKDNIPNSFDLPKKSTLNMKKLVSVYSQLRGKGSTIIHGKQSGKFNFSFTSNGYKSYLLFRDILGRKILLLEINGVSINAWDMIQNQKYDQTTLVILFPFIEFLSPDNLTKLLWGLVPNLNTEINNKFEFENKNVKMTFESNKQRVGSLIQKITYLDELNMDKYEILITNREFGSNYPDLERGIPESIPIIKP